MTYYHKKIFHIILYIRNFLNYSIFTFGLYNSDTDGIAAYVDTDKFANGFHLNTTATIFSNHDGTKFRMIPKTNYDKFVFLYQYTDSTLTANTVMLSSFVNPHKKIHLEDTTGASIGEIYSYSTTNDQSSDNFQFSITPYVESFTSRIKEGYEAYDDSECTEDININIKCRVENIYQEINKNLMPLDDALFYETSPGPLKYAASLLGLCSYEARLPIVEIEEVSKTYVKDSLGKAGLL